MLVAIAYNAVDGQARADERDVLAQVEAVSQAIQTLGHRFELVPVTPDLAKLLEQLQRMRPQVVFNLVEALAGSDRLAPLAAAVIEQAGWAITGCAADALWLTNHKSLSKQQMAAAGLPTPAWYEPSSGFVGGCSASDLSSRPFILKPIFEHASLGMDASAIVSPRDAQDLAQQVAQRTRQLGRPCFAEQFVEGREFNLSLLASDRGCDVLPLAEIDFSAFPAGKPRIVDYAAKWDEASFEFQHTPRRFGSETASSELGSQLTTLAVRCWQAFQLGGYARVDFRVDTAGHPWILEINTNPCLSPDAGFQAALKEANVTFAEAVARILDDAISHSPVILPAVAVASCGSPTEQFAAAGSLSHSGDHLSPSAVAVASCRSPSERLVAAGSLSHSAAAMTWRSDVRPDDPGRVRSLVAATGYFYPDEVAVAEELVTQRLVQGEASGYFFVFAERHGELLGYACYGPIACTRDSYDLYWIAVDPKHQGMGLGRQILEHSEQAIGARGGRRVYIETSNRPQYESTRRFYERCQYTREATLTNFYGPDDDKVIYVRVLDEPAAQPR